MLITHARVLFSKTFKKKNINLNDFRLHTICFNRLRASLWDNFKKQTSNIQDCKKKRIIHRINSFFYSLKTKIQVQTISSYEKHFLKSAIAFRLEQNDKRKLFLFSENFSQWARTYLWLVTYRFNVAFQWLVANFSQFFFRKQISNHEHWSKLNSMSKILATSHIE